MFGHELKCDECGATWLAGHTTIYESEVLPGASFWRVGDERGWWVLTDDKTYCGPCSDKEFPQILAPGVMDTMVVESVACF